MATDESKGAMCTYLYLSILAVNNVDGGDNGIEEKWGLLAAVWKQKALLVIRQDLG